MEMLVMRHGSTENNARGRYRGHLQLPLTAKGVLEASDAVRFLKQLPSEQRPDWVVSSDLPSAKQTAAICARALGLKMMKPLRNLRGMDIGSFAGKPKKEAEAALMECFRHPDESCGGGDSPNEFDARCEKVFAAIRKVAGETDKIPLVVAHGSNTVYLYKTCEDCEEQNYQEPPVEPGGIIRYNGEDATPIWRVSDHANPLPLYPQDHKAGMVVPKGGSNCAKCEFLGDNKLTCTNKYFIAWNGSGVIPGPIDSYCSDWFEPEDAWQELSQKV